MSINTNIAALRVQRRLAESERVLSSSFERLSSGKRINRASDDAAGLAIADRLRVSARLYSTAVRNIGDGISLLNIASGGLTQQAGIIQRLIELAEQSANGTFSSEQRESLEKEYRTLLAEFGRIGDTTRFNGQDLLRGTRGGLSAEIALQAGIDSSADSRISVRRAESGSMSGTINLDELGSGGATDWLITEFVSPRNSYQLSELTSVFEGPQLVTTGRDSQGREREVFVGLVGDDSSGGLIAIGFVRSLSDPDQWLNTISFLDLTSIPFDENGYFIDGAITDPASIGLTNGELASINIDLTGLRLSGRTSLYGQLPSSDATSAIDFTTVREASSARTALEILRTRLDQLSSVQGDYGATMSRLETALGLLQASGETAQAAESRIRDADIAAESARLVASQISQQVASAILAQANNAPQIVLGLLGRG